MIVKTVGRGQESSIVVTDSKVSRIHLQLVQDDNGNISVVDLDSTNGTYVNGIRIVSETRLKEGDTFECSLIIEGEPLYLDNLSQGNQQSIAYVCGKQSGVLFEYVIPST